MPRFKKYSPLYNKLLLLLVIIILACGPGKYDINEFPGYFMPQSGYTPLHSKAYYYSPAFIYTGRYQYWDAPPSYKQDDNLKEWKKYLGISVKDSIAAAIIYKGKDDPGNLFYQALRKKPAAWNYLLLARKIEKASRAGGSRWDPKPADTAGMKSTFTKAVHHLKNTTDPFLKDKYAFQSIKLADELKLYDSCIHLYNHYFGDRIDSSVMKYWSWSRVGGAFLSKEDTAQAVYVFAQIFDQCPSRKKQAYMSLRIYHIRFVPAALDYCKNKQEKAAVYTLCALQPWQNGLPLMKALVTIDPHQPYLELIMGREINKNESYYYADQAPYDYRIRHGDTIGINNKDKQALNYFEKLKTFAVQCADNSKIEDHAFWHTAAAYMSYVTGDYKEAASLLSKTKNDKSANPALKQQILLQELLLTTAKAEQVSPELERKVLPLLDSLKNTTSFYKNNALALACNNLVALYKKQPTGTSTGWLCNKKEKQSLPEYAPAKAFLLTMLTAYQMNDSIYGRFVSNTNQYRIEDTTSDKTLNNVIQFYSQNNPSGEDKQFMQLTHIGQNYLYWIKGRRAMRLFHYKQAVEAWQHVTDTFWHQEPFKTYLAANPFSTQILDTHAPVKADTIKYTPYQFAKRMFNLSNAVKSNKANAAGKYYLLGCGAYNMSYYGNSWLLTKRRWGSVDIPWRLKRALNKIDSINYYTTNRAKNYFDTAMQLASNKGLAAKACFMAAKCEQKEFYVYCARNNLWDAVSSDNIYYFNRKKHQRIRDSLRRIALPIANKNYRHYFKLLKKDYSKTPFSKEVIKQCALYHDFALGK